MLTRVPRATRTRADGAGDVEDHGTPIRAQDLERVFEPFVVLDGRDQGSGIGLAVSRTMVRDSGGELSVECQADNLTRFHLDLPLAAENR